MDELNAWLGFVRASALRPPTSTSALVHIQRDLFALGAQLADPSDAVAARVSKVVLGDADVERLEGLIDRLEAELPPLRRFILAGGPGGRRAPRRARPSAGARNGGWSRSPRRSTPRSFDTSTDSPTCCSCWRAS